MGRIAERLGALVWIGGSLLMLWLMFDLTVFNTLTPQQDAHRDFADRVFAWVLFGSLALGFLIAGIREWRAADRQHQADLALEAQRQNLLNKAKEREKQHYPYGRPPESFVEDVRIKLERFKEFGIDIYWDLVEPGMAEEAAKKKGIIDIAEAVWNEIRGVTPTLESPYDLFFIMGEVVEDHPSTPGVYDHPSSFEIMAIMTDSEEDPGCYKEMALELRDLSKGLMPLEDVEEILIDKDRWPYRRRELIFKLKGKLYRWPFEVEGKSLNFELLKKIGALMHAHGGGYRFACFIGGSQGHIIRLHESQLSAFNEFIGMDFEWLDEIEV